MGIFNDNIHNPHTPGTTQGPVGPPGPGFKLTRNGNFNVDGKRLTNVVAPTGDDDATTKKYVHDHVSSTVDLTPYLKKDGSVALTGDLDIGGHKISNIARPTS